MLSAEKSKNPNYLTIYTIQETKGKFKVVACKLSEFWPEKTKVRINNKCDRTETPLAEDVIKNQIDVAETKKKWHNSEHFAYFCRYGPVEILRMRKVSYQISHCAIINLDGYIRLLDITQLTSVFLI